MIRNLKALGVAMVAMVAMSAIVASAAHAAVYTGSKSGVDKPTVIDGTQIGENIFTAGGTEVKCKEANFSSESATGSSTTLTVKPTYNKCTFGTTSENATVTMNECDYTFTEPTTPVSGVSSASVDLFCPSGKRVEIHVYTSSSHTTSLCTLTVFPKSGTEEKIGGGVTLTNKAGPPKDVEVSANMKEITYEGHGALCPAGIGNTVVKHDGTYTGKVTVTGTNEGAQIDVEVR